MFIDCRYADAKKISHSLLRQPHGFITQEYLNFHLAVGRGIE